MAAATDITLLNNTNTYQFSFRGVSSFSPRKSQPAIVIPFIGTPPASTFLFRFSGQTEEINFTFAIFNDGVDVSNGTYGSPIITVDAQILYLKNFIYTNEIGTDWTLTQPRYYATGADGVITDLTFDNPAGGVSLVTGTLSFIRGFVAPL